MSTTLLAGVIVAAVVLLDRIGVLERLKIFRPSATAALDELEVSDRERERLKGYVADRDALIAELRQQRTNEPVLDLVAQVAELCAETLAKLASFNGTLRHIEEGMADTRNGLHDASSGLKTVVGLLAELHSLRMEGRE